MILGILAAAALPKFLDLGSAARIASLNGLAASMQSAASLGRSKGAVTAGCNMDASACGGTTPSYTDNGKTIYTHYNWPSGWGRCWINDGIGSINDLVTLSADFVFVAHVPGNFAGIFLLPPQDLPPQMRSALEIGDLAIQQANTGTAPVALDDADASAVLAKAEHVLRRHAEQPAEQQAIDAILGDDRNRPIGGSRDRIPDRPCPRKTVAETLATRRPIGIHLAPARRKLVRPACGNLFAQHAFPLSQKDVPQLPVGRHANTENFGNDAGRLTTLLQVAAMHGFDAAPFQRLGDRRNLFDTRVRKGQLGLTNEATAAVPGQHTVSK